MFETRIQTYWADSDAAGIAYFSHFFRFVESAEENLFRAAGADRQLVLDEQQVWLPRVESFAKFRKPIKVGSAILVRLHAEFKGSKTVRCRFEIFEAEQRELLAEGYVTVVCVSRSGFKGIPMPEPIRRVFETANLS